MVNVDGHQHLLSASRSLLGGIQRTGGGTRSTPWQIEDGGVLYAIVSDQEVACYHPLGLVTVALAAVGHA